MYLINTNILKHSSILLIYCGYLKNKKPNIGQKKDRLKKRRKIERHTPPGAEGKRAKKLGGLGVGVKDPLPLI